MNAVKHLVMAAGLAVAMMGGMVSQGQAAQVSLVLRNPTSETIHYQFKWGSDGTWKNYTLEPGIKRAHYFDFDEDEVAPAPYVRFDCIANDADITYKTYHLTSWEVRNSFNGKPYIFQWDGRLLDLYKD